MKTALIIKIISMKLTIREIRREFIDRDQLNTNIKIGISSRDADMRGLTDDLNKTLEKVREKYHLYAQGDMKVKRTITNVSHDLRTPLTAICGYLGLIRQKNFSQAEQLEEIKSYLSIIENRSLYMKGLTEELFEFSGVIGNEEDKQLETEDIFLNKALEDSIMDYYGALSKNGIEPQVEITEEKIIRKINKQAVERIFANLMSNALKYSNGDLKIALNDDGIITFSNYAPDLSSVDVTRLFDRFYTVETGKTSTGLGLAIVKMLVDQMSGTVTAAQEDGYLVIKISFLM